MYCSPRSITCTSSGLPQMRHFSTALHISLDITSDVINREPFVGCGGLRFVLVLFCDCSGCSLLVFALGPVSTVCAIRLEFFQICIDHDPNELFKVDRWPPAQLASC